MTPSRSSPTWPSCGWTRLPASSSGPGARTRRGPGDADPGLAGSPKLWDPDRFDAWLHRLTVNACFDQARKRRRRVIEVELTPNTDLAISDESAAHADRELVDQVLRRLDDRGRAIVVLHYYLGMPLSDVAVTLGIPIGTVKSRLHRALGEMRLAIGPDHRSNL